MQKFNDASFVQMAVDHVLDGMKFEHEKGTREHLAEILVRHLDAPGGSALISELGISVTHDLLQIVRGQPLQHHPAEG